MMINKIKRIVSGNIDMPGKADLDDDGLWVVSFTNIGGETKAVKTLVDWDVLKRIHDRLCKQGGD